MRALVFADFVDRDDVRMVEGRGRPRFPREPRQTIRVPRELGGQYFQGQLAAQSRVFSQIDLTHPARAEFVEDAIMGDRFGDHVLKWRQPLECGSSVPLW